MPKKESNYFGYTESEVRKIEGQFYNLQFGGDFVIEDGCYLFTKAEIAKLYNKMLKDLVDIVSDGTPKDQKYALDLIGGLIIKPMRLH